MRRLRRAPSLLAAMIAVTTTTGCGNNDRNEVQVATAVRHETFAIEPVWEIDGDDPREAAHGIDIIEVGGDLAVIWAAQDGPSVDGDWTHDIQRAIVDKNSPDLSDATVDTLVGIDGAQEPASSAVSGSSSITTWEDDIGEVLSQRYMLYQDGEAMWDEPRNAFEGGHSGHASSAESWHAIALSEGWTDGGGVDNLGSGNEVYLVTMDLDGSNERAVYVDGGRSWWPLTASSADTTAVLWQKFAPDAQSANLKFAVFAPGESGDFAAVSEVEVASDIAYYEYEVSFLPEIDSFIVAGNTSDEENPNRGFIALYDSTGQEVARQQDVPPFVRESKPAIDTIDSTVRVTYPTAPSGFQTFFISADRIDVGEAIDDDFQWPTSGTAAAVTGEGQRYFVAFREDGIEQLYLD